MPIVKTVIFTVLVPGSVTLLVPYLLYSRLPRVLIPLGPFRLVGVVAILAGAATYLRCAWDFAVFGRGTPAPIDPPKRLVVRGFYLYSRNPMYLGIASVLLGEAILFQSVVLALYWGAVSAMFHLFVVFYEEPVLSDAFGNDYEDYVGKVPRWIPRWRILRRRYFP